MLDGGPAVAIPVFQLPGANALNLSTAVRATMKELAKNFPEGVSYEIDYDPTVFVRSSIEAVVHTLFEAVLLVVLVVVVFLQTWRASVIPLVAVPVAIIGTLAALLVAGFSINSLTLFGLVLATGIVVDDAIVVVENIERKIEDGLNPHAAAHAAMGEVTRPIISIMLVLCAVFVPVAFVSGLTGQFYRQFGITIAASTIISTFNSLTLVAGAGRAAAQAEKCAARCVPARHQSSAGWLFRAVQPWLRARLGALRPWRVASSRPFARRCSSVFAVLLIGTWGSFTWCPAVSYPHRTSSTWSASCNCRTQPRSIAPSRWCGRSRSSRKRPRASITPSASRACRCRASSI